ncbi:hypothetical protein [Eggerthella guodeyinii]|uniref:Uncharacterized protein n=1 Tax=Eggerthella guodeyinii TaxID=2690837 RepID=A0A6N7RJZ1_9ACTN|nr:hypothetical protein [Eggerthella guodeyinii]MRX81220.1 hypothetical protein [Eggerthella guodeyinii]
MFHVKQVDRAESALRDAAGGAMRSAVCDGRARGRAGPCAAGTRAAPLRGGRG